DTVEPALSELEALSKAPDTPPLHQRVFCGITGGGARAETQQELVRRLEAMEGIKDPLVVDASPAYLLQAGLPYTYAEMAIILDENPTDVPERYREIDNARKLLGIVADAVRTDGVVICPAKAWELQDYAREQDLRVAIFRVDNDITRRDERVAMAVARVRDG